MPFCSFREGASREEIRGKLASLRKAGIDSFIGSTRSSQYMGSGFWKDMDVMVEEVENAGMTFWLMDEQDFPTGSANGWVKNRRPDLAKLFVDRRHIDAVGPLAGASFSVGAWLEPNNFTDLQQETIESHHEGGMSLATDHLKRDYYEGNSLIAVLACKKNGDDGVIDGAVCDVTDKVTDGFLMWDVPEGFWRIIVIFRTRKSTGRVHYINVIDRDAVRLLIDSVYEPMYERYGNRFGKTFRGFFNDEPEFGNSSGYGVDYDNGVGKRRIPLPWSGELETIFKEKYGADYYKALPALWYDMGRQKTAEWRVRYMDEATRLYRKNFIGQIGEWCVAHGCECAGHILEDGGNTTRLGASAGHFFRAQKGQTVSGVDFVYDQLTPGFDSVNYYWTTGNHDGEEFTYALAKTASSAAHIDPVKRGFSLCETYCGYEPVHGLKHLKYACDNLVSRGVNYMMPCFREDGLGLGSPKVANVNPQWRYFGVVNNYLSRICTLQKNGRHVAPAAVLYHAEAEWAGGYMNCARPVKIMAQDQIDCDIIPQDVFTMKGDYLTEYARGALKVNGEEYGALVIPYCEFITGELAEAVCEIDIPVAFVDAAPSAALSGGEKSLARALAKCEVVPLPMIAKWLRSKGAYDIELSSEANGLRYYKYKREGLTSYLFFNEFPYDSVRTSVSFPETGGCAFYDAMSNKIIDAGAREQNGRTIVDIALYPYETVFVLFGDLSGASQTVLDVYENEMKLEGPWNLASSHADDYPAFTGQHEISELLNMGRPDRYQNLYGTLRYTKVINGRPSAGKVRLDLGDAFETAEVRVNGKAAGVRVCPPYHFDVSGLLTDGENLLEIDITGTNRNFSSQTSMYEPFGLLGPVRLLY